MNQSLHRRPAATPILFPSLVTAASVTATFIVTSITMSVFHAHGADALLILLPCWIALGWLGVLFALRVSSRSHFALATTSALLTIATSIAYVPSWSDGGSCMGGMVLFAFMPFSAAFPIVFFICWLLYGLNRNA